MAYRASQGCPPMVLSIPAPYLFILPILCIAGSIGLFSQVLPAVVESCQRECVDVRPLAGQIACFLSAFFKQCLSHKSDSAFMACILALVSALLTVSHVEASRLVNQQSNLLTRPAWIWFAVNAITCAIVSPIVLCASIVRSRNAAEVSRGGEIVHHGNSGDEDEGADENIDRDENQSLSNVDTRAPVAASATWAYQTRSLSSQKRTFSIPIAVAIGFVIPSILLLADPNPAVAAAWNIFPFAIYLVDSAAHRLLGGVEDNEHYHAENNTGSAARIYCIPIAFSTVAHFYLVASLAREPAIVWTPSTKLMFINFCFMFLIYLYWILIESSTKTFWVTVLITCVAGPGAGVSIGWILKERRLFNVLRSEST